MHIAWWLWVSIGIIILLMEALTPGGFYLLFIGLAAIIVGAFAPLIGILWVEIIAFAVLSTVLIASCRKPLVNRLRKDTPTADVPEFIGETARILETIAARGNGAVELRGTVWNVQNGSDSELVKDSLCTIMTRDGLKLVVQPKQNSK